MEHAKIRIKPQSATRVSDSAQRLGTTLAGQQLGIVRDAYAQRYEQGITSLWQAEIHGSHEIGNELAALRLEAQRQFMFKVSRTVLLMGVPCGLVGAWGFGLIVGVIFFVGSVFLGIYFGSR